MNGIQWNYNSGRDDFSFKTTKYIVERDKGKGKMEKSRRVRQCRYTFT